MSQSMAQTDISANLALDDLRRRLGLDEHQGTEQLTALASGVDQPGEARRRIEAQEVLELLEADPSQQLMTRILLDDEQVRRLADVLDRGCPPTPALHRLLESLANLEHRLPGPQFVHGRTKMNP